MQEPGAADHAVAIFHQADVAHGGRRGRERPERLDQTDLAEAGILHLLDGGAQDDVAGFSQSAREGRILIRISRTLEQDIEGDGSGPFPRERRDQLAVQAARPGAGLVHVPDPVGVLVDGDDADILRDGADAPHQE